MAKLAALTGLALTLICLADCSTAPQPGAQVSASPTASSDPLLKTPGDGIVFGAGWFPLETFKGDTFRWATNDAAVTACPDTNDRTLALQLEPGPGINGTNTPTAHIAVMGNHGDAAKATLKGRQWVKVSIGNDFPAETFVIHAESQNHSAPGDKRILNYRVISAALGSTIGQCKREIVFDGSPLRLGANWYPYETSAGKSFRWVRDNAQLVLTTAQAKPFTLVLGIAPGPSLGETLALSADDGRGNHVAASPVAPPSTLPSYVAFQFPAEPAATTITLSAPSKHLPVTKDPRTLNFRVFSATVRR